MGGQQGVTVIRATDSEVSRRTSAWLSLGDWQFVQKSVPITCVDVLPIGGPSTRVERIGLIQRETPDQGVRWCLIGGRLLRNESFAEGVIRQVRETLGTSVRCDLPDDLQPVYVAQYFTVRRGTGSFDPRQHAVSLIFGVTLDGPPSPTGEAFDFRWFERSALPRANQLGFGQEPIIAGCLDRLDALAASGQHPSLKAQATHNG